MKKQTMSQKVTNAVKYSLTALVAVIAMTGCGKSSNNNPNNGVINNGWGFGACTTGCVNSGSVNVSAMGRNEYSGITLQIQFIGQQSTGSYGSSTGSYYGPVQAQGTLTVQTQMYQQCGLPAGSYSVSSQQGTWQGTSIFQNIVLQSSSGVQIQMQGWTKTSASTGGIYGMSANLYPMGQSQCEIVLY